MVGALMAAFVLVVAPQEPGSGVQDPVVPVSPVQYDERGWPIVPDQPARRSVVPGAAAAPQQPKPTPGAAGSAAATPPSTPLAEVGAGGAGLAPVASGMDLGSPLLDVFQFTRSPSAFKKLAGQTIWWRITVYGAQGEKLGIRELTHTVDCGFLERDRLAYEQDGRVYGRVGPSVYAERQGMPWGSDVERGGHELALFGTHLRMPWCFGDGITYSVVSTGTVDRPGERLRQVVLERRPLGGADLIGPELDPRPRDRFELIYEAGTGMPREFVHRFAASQGARRVLLDGWQEYEGIRIPYVRTYIDDTLRRTTVIEILNITPQQVSDRTFRLHG